ncbi:signal peptidase I [Candidatus Woesearchaeota archaeon]|nr:signal peptidase I [Candidatus Woesearchaeota archaeon]MBT3438839.1 signal peptidase I [Candidatus Woesearchaeota archaeon]MBT4057937.1 signal peptidase I [Candidatus Woesearchaeota archaeon]MBT4208671.1 signal peptidase I [Candidatus Woesearchaeota archaeon]MBT4732634.1 signal peptidase I [Candidatus Woesearchaeota archaeon]
MRFLKSLKKFWHFVWYDDSLASWIVNLLLAFVLVKFVIYPLVGLFLSTSFPIVAVVSGSMEHEGLDFDAWWENNGKWYEENGVSKEQFEEFRYINGFNKGDIMFLKGVTPKNIKVGDVLVYETSLNHNPIIHRVVELRDGKIITKGDNNGKEDKPVEFEQVARTGKAVLKLPWFGWIKIWFVDFLRFKI